MILRWLVQGKSQILCAETKPGFKPGLKEYLEITLGNKLIVNVRRNKNTYKIPKLAKRN